MAGETVGLARDGARVGRPGLPVRGGGLPGGSAGGEAGWMRPRSRAPRGVLVAAGAAVLVAAGIAGYLSFGYSPWEAAAMTLLTLTTVGFASGDHLSTGVLAFTAGLAFLGVGLAIARELEAEGVPFVVVDSKAELEPDLEGDLRCYLIGDASDEAVLREAGIERAKGLICAVDSDAQNVFITVVARSLSPGLLIVARAAREQSADRLRRAGATHVVSPYVTSGRRMANLALRPNVVEFFDVAGADQPGLRLEELAITEGSPLAGRSLRELRGPMVPLLIRHPDGQLIANPSRELQLQAGDVLVIFGETSDLNPLDRD